MKPTLADLARRLNAPLARIDAGADIGFSRVISDTRQLQPGDLFVALVGDRFDGHDYLEEARQRGAVGALVSHAVDVALPQVLVSDTLVGLQDYARSWRSEFANPVVAVTGSNGKTTTKQLLAAVLAARGPVLATEGNLNNHIGVPLTLARLRDDYSTAVIELGANHLHEIEALAALAQPQIGIVTQAGDAHLEGFGSRDGVARGKGELFAAIAQQPQGVAIINADDVYAPLWSSLAGPAQQIRFGLSSDADVSAAEIESYAIDDGRNGMRFTLSLPTGEASVNLPLPGRHNVLNALAAAAAGYALGLSVDVIAAGLAQVQAPSGRVAWKRIASNARLIDDSYNANPTSLDAGLQLLAALPGERWAVLGGMAELGATADSLHVEAGKSARALGLDRLYVTGAMSPHYATGFGEGTRVFATHAELIAALQADVATCASPLTLLVKGSRSARMETVVQALVGGADGGVH